MSYLKKFESIDSLQTWINQVLENCRDILLEMDDLGHLRYLKKYNIE